MEKIIKYLSKKACAESLLSSMWEYVSEGKFQSAMDSHLFYLVLVEEARETTASFTEEEWKLLNDVCAISVLGDVYKRK